MKPVCTVYASGDRMWAVGRSLHREDGPAVVYKNGDKEWWVNGKRHRDDGPAVVDTGGYKAWFLRGVFVAHYTGEVVCK